MVRSTVNPSIFWIRKIIGQTAFIRVRWNVKPIVVKDMDDREHSEFEYDEQELLVQLPPDISSVESLSDFLAKEKEKLLSQAKDSHSQTRDTSFSNEKTWCADIERVRAELNILEGKK
jgi:predicted metal-dependent hydrolase